MIPSSPKTFFTGLALILSCAASNALAHGSETSHSHTNGGIAVIEAKLAPGERISHVTLSDPTFWAVEQPAGAPKGILILRAYKPDACTRVLAWGDKGSSLRSWLCSKS
jgi:hypothetical protein